MEGQWVKLFRAGDAQGSGDNPYTSADLDEIVNNSPNGVPVVFGPPKDNGPQLAKIAALKRDGNTLLGKFSGVDPRLDQLSRAGKLSKLSSMLKRTPEGKRMLHRVGVTTPTYSHGAVRAADANVESLLAALKNANEDSISSVFSERAPVDENSVEMCRLARARSREKSIEFGEALREVAQERPELAMPKRRTTPQSTDYSKYVTIVFAADEPLVIRGVGRRSVARGFPVDENSQRLSDLARERSREQKISFSEALTEVAAENPELTIPGR